MILLTRGTASYIDYARRKGWLTGEETTNKPTTRKHHTTHQLLSIRESGKQFSLAQAHAFSEMAYTHRIHSLVSENIKKRIKPCYTEYPDIPSYTQMCTGDIYAATAIRNTIRLWNLAIPDKIICQETININKQDFSCSINYLHIKNEFLLYNKKMTHLHETDEFNNFKQINIFTLFNIKTGYESDLASASEKFNEDSDTPISYLTPIFFLDRIFFMQDKVVPELNQRKIILHEWNITGKFIQSVDMNAIESTNRLSIINFLAHHDKYIVSMVSETPKLLIYNLKNRTNTFVNVQMPFSQIFATCFHEDQLICGFSNLYAPLKTACNGCSIDLKSGTIIRNYQLHNQIDDLPTEGETSVNDMVIADNHLYVGYKQINKNLLSVTNLLTNNSTIIDEENFSFPINYLKVDGPVLLAKYGHNVKRTAMKLKIWDRNSLQLFYCIELIDNLSNIVFKAGQLSIIPQAEALLRILLNTDSKQTFVQINYATTEQKEENSFD